MVQLVECPEVVCHLGHHLRGEAELARLAVPVEIPGPEEKTTLTAAPVPNTLVEQPDELREKRGWNRSQAVTEAIRELVQKS